MVDGHSTDKMVENARKFPVKGGGRSMKIIERLEKHAIQRGETGSPVKTKLLSSVKKAKRLLNYKPQMGFGDGLKNVHGWLAGNWEDIKGSGGILNEDSGCVGI